MDPNIPSRLTALRAELTARGVCGLFIPHADEYQNEYLPENAERLAWVTGFTGSAGAAVILRNRAAIFVDGRYTLQAAEQVPDAFEQRHLIESPPESWLTDTLQAGDKLGYDPRLSTPKGVRALEKACKQVGAALVPLASNPIDALWTDRPPRPASPARPHPVAFAGEDSAAKRHRLAEALRKDRLDAAIITACDSIAWLLNIRGADVAFNPLCLSFAALYADGSVDWFVHADKVRPELLPHLGPEVRIHPEESVAAALDALGATGRKVRVDPTTTAAWFFDRLSAAGAEIDEGDDPCRLPRARKNPVELDGARAAHRRDGAALVRFLAWVDARCADGGTDELAASDHLESLRREAGAVDLSFASISGSGANGAIVHYRSSPETNRPLEQGNLYLIDSGGQYPDGTTDVTRTVAVGTPTDEHRDRFTRVLKGHIALSMARFPKGTTGTQLDALARLPLWEVGLDYDHGTGHGVGSYLCVHEGPHRIAKVANAAGLEPGMIVSNEPGYYKAGAYGIRIENLIAVRPLELGDRPMFGFETLTRAPIDTRLVDVSLLTGAERAWLNEYHRQVREDLSPLLDEATRGWLEQATAAV